MKTEITRDEVLQFHNQYCQNQKNIEIESKIRTQGILKASIDNERMNNFEFAFNIEVPECKIYNQLGSYQCNIFAFLRVVKDILRKNTELDIEHLDLSSNYINFYDKLEKANSLYNELISCDNLSIDIIINKANFYIGSFGTFHSCREIVNKYGIVPVTDMKELDSNYNDSLTIELLRRKMKEDAIGLIKIDSKSEKMAKKEEFMYEVFQFLSKVYGVPPIDFEYDGRTYTPLEFKNQYLKDCLDEFVTVTPYQKEVFLESYSFLPNIYLNDNEKILHLPLAKIKEAIIKQLRNNVSVWFSSEESTTLDYDINILDDQLYNISHLLHIRNIHKNKRLLLDTVNYDHAMCITGVLVKDGKIIQLKVDNSFGKHGKFQGKLIMTNSFLEHCVITLIIHKSYLE